MPFHGEKWNLITHTIISVNSVPQGETDSVFGLGNITLQLMFTPASPGDVIWGVGPVLMSPTASNPEVLGSEKFGIGPAGILFYQTGKWTMGGIATNIWSVAGESDRDDINLFPSSTSSTCWPDTTGILNTPRAQRTRRSAYR